MSEREIVILRDVLKSTNVFGSDVYWIPDSSTARRVLFIGTHAEEGPNAECAIFDRGEYVALYNAVLSDFAVIHRVMVGKEDE